MIPVDLLFGLAIAAQVAGLVIHRLRRRLDRLPEGLPPGEPPPPVVLLKPVLCSDAATLARCRAWIESAAAYPGRATVVFSTLDAAAGALSGLSREYPWVVVRVVSCAPDVRRHEPGLDKAHRLMAAVAAAEEILAGEDGIFLACDEDVEPLDLRCVERLAAAIPKPGVVATVTGAPTPDDDAPWFAPVGAANVAFNNQVYALADVAVPRLQGVLLGWTLAVWASDLRAAGGFARAGGELTEEVVLGAEFAKRGTRTRFFDDSGLLKLREQHVSLTEWWHQQVRWRAQLRACPGPVLVLMTLLLTLCAPLLASLAFLVASPGVPAAALVATALLISQQTLGIHWKHLWVVPCQEVLILAAQAAGMLTRRVRWGRWEYRTDLRSGIVGKRWLPFAEAPGPATPEAELLAAESGRVGG